MSKAVTVQELIEQLQAVEDKERTVMVAGGSPWDGVALVGSAGKGQVILWCAEKWRKAEPEVFAMGLEVIRKGREEGA